MHKDGMFSDMALVFCHMGGVCDKLALNSCSSEHDVAWNEYIKLINKCYWIP